MLATIQFCDDEPGQMAPRGTPGSTLDAKQSTIVIASGHAERAEQLAALLREDGDVVTVVHDRSNALRTIAWQLPDLIIIDAQLDGAQGIALCASLKLDVRTRSIPLIIAADPCRPDEHLRAIEADTDDYLPASDLNLLRARAGSLLRAKRWADDLVPLDYVIQMIEQAVEAKDDVTGAHGRRLGRYSALIGRRLGLSDQALEVLCAGARLHDVGKIGVDDMLLRKPSRLTADEYRNVQQHPLIGEQILASLHLPPELMAIIRHHHERWDGRGYPDGLGGVEIPLCARIVSVADAFDAMTAERPYTQPVTIDAAVGNLRKGAGAQWDPAVVEALIDSVVEIVPCRERAVGAEELPEPFIATYPPAPLRLRLA